MSRKDKIALFCSTLFLLAILTAGAYGLSRIYHYNTPSSPPAPGLEKK